MVTCFFVRLFFYQCWPDGPLDTNVDFDFHRLSFYLQNECLCQTSVSHENHLIFMRMTVQVTYIFIPIVSLKDSFCQSGKSKLGIGLFIHELLREPLIHIAIWEWQSFLSAIKQVCSQPCNVVYILNQGDRKLSQAIIKRIV